MMAACMRPDVVGPMVIWARPSLTGAVSAARTPALSGRLVRRKLARSHDERYRRRHLRRCLAGRQLRQFNPANTFWTKRYSVWTDPEHEKDRYLHFEKWWGDFVLLRGEEMQWMVDNLFISNKFSTGQLATSDGIRLDIREVKTPIVCFCSHGDNITPPQQALDGILDNYQSVDEIEECGQKIFYNVDPKVGHLAIFVGTRRWPRRITPSS